MTVATIEVSLAQVVIHPAIHELRPDYVGLLLIFRPGAYDEGFHRLEAATQAITELTQGFLGSETWWSDDRAKARYDRWYDGYQVVIAEVPGADGDGRLPHITSPISNVRRPPAVRGA